MATKRANSSLDHWFKADTSVAKKSFKKSLTEHYSEDDAWADRPGNETEQGS